MLTISLVLAALVVLWGLATMVAARRAGARADAARERCQRERREAEEAGAQARVRRVGPYRDGGR